MLIIFILYLAILFAITAYTARMSKNSSDFISGGKKIGGVALALSERATGESAWLILGLTGEAYLIGIQAIWFALGCVLGIFFIWFVMGNRLRKESEATGALTVTSMISRKFPGAEKAIGLISSLIVIFFLLFYITAQFYGGGKVLFDTFGINQTWGIVIGSLVVVVYCMIGGFITVVATDVFQALLMIISVIVMPIILLYLMSINHIDIAAGLQKAGATYLSATGGKTGMGAFLLILSGMSWALGYTGQPQLLTRMMVIRNEREYRKAKWVAGIWTFFAYAGALLIGFAGIVFVKEGLVGADAVARLAADKGFELIFPVLVNAFMPAVIAGFLLSGAISAMMSTASSEIILCSSAITEDVYGNYAKKKMAQKKELWFNRIITLLVGLVAFFLALHPSDSIFKMVSYAWSGIGSSFGPAILLVLFWKKISRAGVIASLLSGTVGTIIWKEFFEKPTEISERLTSFMFALAMAVLFSLLIPKKKSIVKN